MHQRPIFTAVLALVVTALLAPPAFARDDVKVSLTAQRIITSDRGEERKVSADEARPGEVLEYTARYQNTGRDGVQSLIASMPIPAGTAYVAGSASPANVLASVDGKTFAPVPLKRQVRLADGSTAEQTIPFDEYRYLQWTIGALDAKASRSVSARVRLAPAGELAVEHAE